MYSHVIYAPWLGHTKIRLAIVRNTGSHSVLLALHQGQTKALPTPLALVRHLVEICLAHPCEANDDGFPTVTPILRAIAQNTGPHSMRAPCAPAGTDKNLSHTSRSRQAPHQPGTPRGQRDPCVPPGIEKASSHTSQHLMENSWNHQGKANVMASQQRCLGDVPIYGWTCICINVLLSSTTISTGPTVLPWLGSSQG
jgi:hypothetical protein